MRHGNTSLTLSQKLETQTGLPPDYGTIFSKPFTPWASRFSDPKQVLNDISTASRDKLAHSEGDNDRIPAGYTYLGQLISHDLTHFSKLKNLSSPHLDLDCVYGEGPVRDFHLYKYEPQGAPRFLFKMGGLGESLQPSRCPFATPYPDKAQFDLPRHSRDLSQYGGSSQNQIDPLLADPRNDQHVIISQLQVVFMQLHNHIASCLQPTLETNEKCFTQARRLVVKCYQDVIRYDYAKRLFGDKLAIDFSKAEPKFFKQPEDSPFQAQKFRNDGNHTVPLEFSLAAGRMGHSMIRNFYKLNDCLVPAKATVDRILEFSHLSEKAEDNLPLPANWIVNWKNLFEFDSAPEQPVEKSRKLNPYFSHQISEHQVDASSTTPETLGTIDLLRSVEFQLPSGQDYARHLRHYLPDFSADIKVHQKDSLKFSNFEHGAKADGTKTAELLKGVFESHSELYSHTPLMTYVLAEAAIENNGHYLGPVGSFIVGVTFNNFLPAPSKESGRLVENMPELIELLNKPSEHILELARKNSTSNMGSPSPSA